jgi:hypothetical protein
MFDGGATYNSATDNSTTYNDASDQAMLAILNDWNSHSGLNLSPAVLSSLISNHDDANAQHTDTLSGGLGVDTASKGADDTGDWENTIS